MLVINEGTATQPVKNNLIRILCLFNSYTVSIAAFHYITAIFFWHREKGFLNPRQRRGDSRPDMSNVRKGGGASEVFT